MTTSRLLRGLLATLLLIIPSVSFATGQKRVVRGDPIALGRMQNPFLTWAGDLSPLQLEYFSAPVRSQSTITGPTPWFIVEMRVVQADYTPVMGYRPQDHVYYAFRFDATGQPMDRRLLPQEMRFVRFKQDARAISAQQNDRWWVIPHEAANTTYYGPGEGTNFEGFYVFRTDAEDWAFTKIASRGTPKGMRAMRLIGDHLFYAYIDNPDATAKSTADDIEKKGARTFGLCHVNLSTGEDTVIAAIGVNKLETPLLAENMKIYRRIMPVGDDAVTFSEQYRLSAYAYEFASGQWRQMTAQEVSKAKSTRTAQENAYDSFLWDKRYWKISSSFRTDHINVRAVGLDDINLPLDFENHGIKPTAHPVGERSRLNLLDLHPNALRINLTPDGIVLHDKMGSYFWIPMETFRAHAEQSYQDLQALKAR